MHFRFGVNLEATVEEVTIMFMFRKRFVLTRAAQETKVGLGGQ